MAAARPGLGPGDSVGPFRLEELLGEGAMGLVYRALREDTGETVALKLLKRALSRDAIYRQRFLREANVAKQVKDRHLVPVIEAGEHDEVHYLAMQYVDGGSLDDRIEADGPLELAECLRITAEVAAGLDALHREGLVHRDVKPSNIMLDAEGRAALTDFGLARGPAFTVLTKPGQVMGTLDYLAPELISGDAASAASDIYALGCVVYECLTGSAPFAGARIFEIAVAHVEQEPRNPCELREGLPADLGWAVVSALAKRPEQRPTTARAYARMLVVAGGPADGR
jgi:serine/threonine protein kinase